MAGLNISLLSLNRRQSSSDKKHNLSWHLVPFFSFCCFFPTSLQFFSSTAKQTKLFHSNFQDIFHFFFREKHFEKNTLRKPFLVKCLRSALQAASAYKRQEFWRKTHTPLWLLIGCIIFLPHEKTSLAILIGCIIFFTCENHHSLLWLARTHIRHSFLVSISQHVYK